MSSVNEMYYDLYDSWQVEENNLPIGIYQFIPPANRFPAECLHYRIDSNGEFMPNPIHSPFSIVLEVEKGILVLTLNKRRYEVGRDKIDNTIVLFTESNTLRLKQFKRVA